MKDVLQGWRIHPSVLSVLDYIMDYIIIDDYTTCPNDGIVIIILSTLPVRLWRAYTEGPSLYEVFTQRIFEQLLYQISTSFYSPRETTLQTTDKCMLKGNVLNCIL